MIISAADALSSAFVNENFDFYGKTLNGTKELQPRWRRCVLATDATLGEALGEVYVKKAFPPEAKARMKSEGMEPGGGTPEECQQLIRRDIEKYTRIVKTAGISVKN